MLDKVLNTDTGLVSNQETSCGSDDIPSSDNNGITLGGVPSIRVPASKGHCGAGSELDTDRCLPDSGVSLL